MPKGIKFVPAWGQKGGYGHEEYPDADQAIRYVEGGPMVDIAEVEVDKIPYSLNHIRSHRFPPAPAMTIPRATFDLVTDLSDHR